MGEKQPWRTPIPNSAVSRAATSAWCIPVTVNAVTANVSVPWPGPSTRTPSMARRPSSRRRARAASCAWTTSQPMRSSSTMAVPKATAPITLGDPASFAVGRLRPDHLVQVDQVDGAATGQEGVTILEGAPRPDQGAGPVGRVELVSTEGDVVGSGWERPVGGQLSRVEQYRDASVVGFATDLLHRREPAGHVGRPRHGEQRGRGPSSSTAVTSATSKVPSGAHSTQRRLATRAQGSRLAWCSTTVVATTASGARRSR